MNGTEILIRPARERDKADMLAITRGVWEGHDYVPYVWDEWLRNPDGRLTVATTNGRMVGLQHSAFHPDNTVWNEGIRVADAARGRGVGGALLTSSCEWARTLGCTAVRLSTTTTNPASNRIADKSGFREIGAFTVLSAEPQHEPRLRMRVIPGLPADLDDVWEFLRRRLPPSTGGHFYTEGWTVYALTPSRLRLLLATASVCVAGAAAIEAVGIATVATKSSALKLGLLVGSRQGMEVVCRALRSVALQSGLERVRATVQIDLDGAAALKSSGFESQSGMSMLLHELQLHSQTGH